MICYKAIIELVIKANNLDSHIEKCTEDLIYLWAMAGDNISKHYSGTSSVLTKITLKGHQNAIDKVEQKLISIRRW